LAKAIQFTSYGNPDVLKLVDASLPELRKDDIRFRVIAAAVNRYDIDVRTGRKPVESEKFSFTPGIEAVGVITECGKGVQGIKVGDHVITMMQKLGDTSQEIPGAYQEYVTVNVYAVMKILEGIKPLDTIALGLTSVAALNGVNRLKLHKGETLLVTGGSGAVGSAAIQIANLLGYKVWATTTHAGKSDYLKSLNVERIIDTMKTSIPDEIKRGSIDAVIDTTGGAVFKDCVRIVKKGGRLCSLGNVAGDTLSLSAADLMQEVILTGYDCVELTGDKLRADLGQLIDWHSSGKIKTPEYKCMSLAGAASAHEQIESNKTPGRILLTPEG
jgi:NADPH2:quinone reductase